MPRTAVLRLLRLANPLVRGLLRSRGHRLLSRWLVELHYEGRRTGRQYAIPVLAAVERERVVVVATMPAHKQWWRTFREPTTARILVRGERRVVVGELLGGEARRLALRTYVARLPWTRLGLGVSSGSSDRELDEVDAVVVAFVTRV